MTAAGLLQVTLVKTSAALRFSKSERACAKSSTVFIILVSVFFFCMISLFVSAGFPFQAKKI